MARDFDSCVSEVASRLRLDTASLPNLLSLCQGWVNDVIQDVHGRHDWFWAMDRQVIQTVIDKTAGTVSVAAGGTAVTGVGTAFASSDVTVSFIQFSGSNDWYKIASVSSALAAVIESPYNGTSALSGGTYILRRVFYTVPNAEKILGAKQATTYGDLVCVNYRYFDQRLTMDETTGKASRYCVYGVDSGDNLLFNIHPHADEAYNLEIRFKKRATEGSIAATPAKWRGVYIDGALARGFEYVALGQPEFDKNLIKMKAADYERGIARMLADAEPESDYQPALRNTDVPNYLPGPHLPDGLSIPLD